MFTTFHEFTVVKLHKASSVPDVGFNYVARGQHVEDDLHVVSGEGSSDQDDVREFVPSPHVEHDSN